MTEEVLIALGALVVAGLSYFAGVHRTKKQFDDSAREARVSREDAAREARINRVVKAYVKLAQASKTNGPDGLLKAGAASLATDHEVRTACARIAEHGLQSPLAAIARQLNGADLVVLFQLAAERRHNFFSGDLDKLIADAKARANEKSAV